MGKKVVICSNNSYFSRSVERDLVKNEFIVKSTRAKNGELIKMLGEITPDLTILDAPMAYIDGIRELMEIRDTLDTPLMMLSTQGSKADTVNALSMASNRPLIKPVTFEELLKQINYILQKK
jgi:DNA-binding response OmpR family regulator